MPKFSFIRSREVFFISSGINSLYRGKNSLYRGKNYLYRGIPFETVWTSGKNRFWFEIWIRAVFSGNRGKYRYRRVPVFSERSVKKTLVWSTGFKPPISAQPHNRRNLNIWAIGSNRASVRIWSGLNWFGGAEIA
jgi:hypothetical protein